MDEQRATERNVDHGSGSPVLKQKLVRFHDCLCQKGDFEEQWFDNDSLVVKTIPDLYTSVNHLHYWNSRRI